MADTNQTPTAPPVGDNTHLDQILHDIFVTALEGGIGYWSCCTAYHWAHRFEDVTESECDLAGFYAVVEDMEDDDRQRRIDRDVIYRGVTLLASATVTGAGLPAVTACSLILANPAHDDIDVDAAIADQIVQAGLLGAVIYG